MDTLISVCRAILPGAAMRPRVLRLLAWTLAAAVGLAAAEMACRAIGLHTPVLYEVTSYGYRVKPNQDVRRFGNHNFYNAFGMRSRPITAMPAAGVLRVLCVGDSITNGGAVTDQDDTYPNQLERLLRAGGRSVEVLNASAPGWAIANEVGWLQENGTFQSRVIMFVIGTTDLFQPLSGADTVGAHPSFPSTAPTLGLEELVMRYVVPKMQRRSLADPGAQSTAQYLEGARENIALLQKAVDFMERKGAKPVVLFVEQPGQFELSDAYTDAAKALMFESLKQRDIPYANTRDSVEHAGGVTLFRDGLHPNPGGNRVLAQISAKLLAPLLDAVSQPKK